MRFEGFPAFTFFLPKTEYKCSEAGLLAQPCSFHLPIRRQWHIEMNITDFTVAGTAPGLNRVPF